MAKKKDTHDGYDYTAAAKSENVLKEKQETDLCRGCKHYVPPLDVRAVKLQIALLEHKHIETLERYGINESAIFCFFGRAGPIKLRKRYRFKKLGCRYFESL